MAFALTLFLRFLTFLGLSAYILLISTVGLVLLIILPLPQWFLKCLSLSFNFGLGEYPSRSSNPYETLFVAFLFLFYCVVKHWSECWLFEHTTGLGILVNFFEGHFAFYWLVDEFWLTWLYWFFLYAFFTLFALFCLFTLGWLLLCWFVDWLASCFTDWDFLSLGHVYL